MVACGYFSATSRVRIPVPQARSKIDSHLGINFIICFFQNLSLQNVVQETILSYELYVSSKNFGTNFFGDKSNVFTVQAFFKEGF